MKPGFAFLLFFVASVSGYGEDLNLSLVEVCRAPTHFREFNPFVGPVLDGVSNTLRLEHAWIRTPHQETGMGPIPHLAVMTEWTDHAGLGNHPRARCYFIPNCDLDCVEQNSQIGLPTGLYSAVNTCQHVVSRVLKYCGCTDRCVEWNRWGLCTRRAWPPLR